MKISWRTNGPELVFAVVFAAAVLGYGIWVAAGDHIGSGPDSLLYLAAAAEPVWSRDFLAGPGPFLFLALAKSCARNVRAIVLVQSVLSAAAWLYLAGTVRGLLRSRPAQLLGFGGVLLLGCGPRVLAWNAFIATESLSLSLLAVSTGLGLRVATGARGITLWLFGLSLAAFGLTRDTNVLVLLPLAIVFAVAAWRRPVWRRAGAGLAALCVLTAGLALTLSNHAEPPRWYWPMHETVALRIVGDESAESYFVQRGLPFDDALQALHDRYYVLIDRMRGAPEYEPLRRWISSDGRSVYARFLATHPDWVLGKPFVARAWFVVPDVDQYYEVIGRNAPPRVLDVTGSIAWPNSVVLGEIWIGAGAVVLVVAARKRRIPAALAGAVAVLGVLAIAGFLAAYHGDALEVDRHALTAAAQMRVACWLVLAALVDGLLRSRVQVHEQAPHHDAEEDRLDGREPEPDPIGPLR